MNRLLNVYKPKGVTPYQVIQQIREQFPEYTDEKIGYAGRLDPLAHGVLLLMIGEANKDRESYLSFDKTYTFTALLGLATDTFDVLGVIKDMHCHQPESNVTKSIEQFIKEHTGTQELSYPPYSSKTVQGKPLFWWAKQGRLSEIVLPKRQVEIQDFYLLEYGKLSFANLKKAVSESQSVVEGDFRQKEIRDNWHEFFEKTNQKTFYTATFSLTCSSGTYVRALVNSLGKSLAIGALTLDILRTRAGNYTLDTCMYLAS